MVAFTRLRSEKSRRTTTRLLSPAGEFTFRNQIRRGTMGGLGDSTASCVRVTQPVFTGSAGAIHRCTLATRAAARTICITAPTVPATISHAVTRNSVSVIGVVGPSHPSKHSSTGVNATSRKNTHATSWRIRLCTIFSISCVAVLGNAIQKARQGNIGLQKNSAFWNIPVPLHRLPARP